MSGVENFWVSAGVSAYFCATLVSADWSALGQLLVIGVGPELVGSGVMA